METIFCKRLKELRLEKNLTQTNIAKVMNVTYNTICFWEKGRSSPNIYELKQIAQFFGVTTDYLLGLED